ncbi:MAG TPA: GNAT family N-acetyltransferase [Cyclobacteriaceae bacterium]|nr:GNAT family N-acetyltransferase [Cyclobacteriaceae bacterium]
MNIARCTLNDAPAILELYNAASALQTSKNVVAWPKFTLEFIENEIRQGKQYKLVVNNEIASNWSVFHEDKEIWGEKDKGDSIYIHRICTNPKHRGNNYMKTIIDWCRQHAIDIGKDYVRLDTLGNNTRLIALYQSVGFDFLGILRLTNVEGLPDHYHKEPNCAMFEMKV